MKRFSALSLLLVSLTLSCAIAAPSGVEAPPDKKSPPAQTVEPAPTPKLQALPKSNVVELEPIQGNLGRPLPKLGPGWRVNSQLPWGIGGGRDVSDPYFGRGSSPGRY